MLKTLITALRLLWISATTQNIWNYIFSAYGDKTIIAVSHEKDLLNHVTRRLEFKKGVGKESK